MYNEKCEILSNQKLTENIYEMTVVSEEMAKAAEAGQFLHIKVSEGLYPLLRRPISIYNVDRKNKTLTIIYHVVGQGTKELSRQKPGTAIDVMGPLGKGFPVFPDKKCAVVGGGIGTAPLLQLAKELNGCDAYLGFRDCGYKVEAFEEYCKAVIVSSEDGSIGHQGYITEQLEKRIAEYEVIYTCGPKPMMKRVMELCLKNNIDCYVSLEERMGCGVGACLVCACKIMETDGEWHHKKVCKDGPVFNAKEVVFDA